MSGIIGVPPGYVGHEEGGRLINELNADPYSVFLLDEAEKCHPNIQHGWSAKTSEAQTTIGRHPCQLRSCQTEKSRS